MSMHYRIPLGTSGIEVAPLGWGMWRFAGASRDAARSRVAAALESGYTLFDTADIYGYRGSDGFGAAEELLGELLREDRSLRSRMVLASKAGVSPPLPYNSSAGYLVSACEASLCRLGTDHLDLYFIHRPDLLSHPAEMANALDQLRTAGKIRAAGVSNFSATQTAALMAFLPFELACIQIEWSPLVVVALQDGVIDLAMQRKLAVLAWSPLAQGRLAQAVPTDDSPRVVAVREALDNIAKRHGVTREVAAYAWIRRHPSNPIPIVGTQNPERIRAAIRACRLELSREEWYRLLEAAQGHRMP
jgi:predicted oxidoreductase